MYNKIIIPIKGVLLFWFIDIFVTPDKTSKIPPWIYQVKYVTSNSRDLKASKNHYLDLEVLGGLIKKTYFPIETLQILSRLVMFCADYSLVRDVIHPPRNDELGFTQRPKLFFFFTFSFLLLFWQIHQLNSTWFIASAITLRHLDFIGLKVLTVLSFLKQFTK